MYVDPHDRQLHADTTFRRESRASFLLAAFVVSCLFAGSFAALQWGAESGRPGQRSAPGFNDPSSAKRHLAASGNASRPPGPAVTVPLAPKPDFGSAEMGRGRQKQPDPSVVSQLSSTCQFWRARNENGRYAGATRLACGRLNDYLQRSGRPELAVPLVSASTNLPVSSKVSGPSAGRRAAVGTPTFRPGECKDRRAGSVAYRKCRAAVKRDLEKTCQELREKELGTTGVEGRKARERRLAVCGAMRRYAIVN